MVEGIGGRQLIFGLDFPWHSLVENRDALETLVHLPVSQDSLQMLLGGTLRALLGLDSHLPGSGSQP